MEIYAATKHAVEDYTASLDHEVHHFSIRAKWDQSDGRRGVQPLRG
ncbi:hypothetical protein KZ820_17480 [Sphingomonas sp. RRHST34]|uniref:Uncharacterized protein n=1 Tax=Sphingomonas citri TaxID=2862499 RepID=A0ABS7BSI4_9SPHN|nr:hypothetical protein [Sphingomonas citri]